MSSYPLFPAIEASSHSPSAIGAAHYYPSIRGTPPRINQTPPHPPPSYYQRPPMPDISPPPAAPLLDNAAITTLIRFGAGTAAGYLLGSSIRWFGSTLLVGVGVGAAAVTIADRTGAITVDWKRVTDMCQTYLVDGIQQITINRRANIPPDYAVVEGEAAQDRLTIEDVQRVVYALLTSPVGAGLTIGAVYAICR